MGDSCEKNLILLLANNKGTDQTTMMAKPAYLSVYLTDNPTSGKISKPQLVSVAEQTGLSNTWSQHPIIYVNMLVYQLCMLTDVTCICRLLYNIFHVSDRVQVNFKQFETLPKFRA